MIYTNQFSRKPACSYRWDSAAGENLSRIVENFCVQKYNFPSVFTLIEVVFLRNGNDSVFPAVKD